MRGTARRPERLDTGDRKADGRWAIVRTCLAVPSLALSLCCRHFAAGPVGRDRIPFSDRTIVLPDLPPIVVDLLRSLDLHNAYLGLFHGTGGVFGHHGGLLMRERAAPPADNSALRKEIAAAARRRRSRRPADGFRAPASGELARSRWRTALRRRSLDRRRRSPGPAGAGFRHLAPAGRRGGGGCGARAPEAARRGLPTDGAHASDRFIDVEGRTIGGRAILRLRDVTGDRADLLLGRSELAAARRDLRAMTSLLDAVAHPLWIRDDRTTLVWANQAYLRRGRSQRSSTTRAARPLELLDAADPRRGGPPAPRRRHVQGPGSPP